MNNKVEILCLSGCRMISSCHPSFGCTGESIPFRHRNSKILLVTAAYQDREKTKSRLLSGLKHSIRTVLSDLVGTRYLRKSLSIVIILSKWKLQKPKMNTS